jgi:YesN/AraC family two-component response regulator
MISEKIVVIDDDERVIRSLRLALNDYELVCFNNGSDGIKYFQRPRDASIVLLDVMMPGIDGLSVLEQLKKINRDLTVIIMTGFGSQEIAVQALRKRADDFIEKPFNIIEIKDKIKNILKERIGENRFDRDKGKHVERIKCFIERNYTNSSLEYIADELCLSPKYISRMFNQKNGSSFRDYKVTVKMERAKVLLKDSSFTVNEISDRLGYLNPESFMRIFKRRTRLTPSQFRRKYERKR